MAGRRLLIAHHAGQRLRARGVQLVGRHLLAREPRHLIVESARRLLEAPWRHGRTDDEEAAVARGEGVRAGRAGELAAAHQPLLEPPGAARVRAQLSQNRRQQIKGRHVVVGHGRRVEGQPELRLRQIAREHRGAGRRLRRLDAPAPRAALPCAATRMPPRSWSSAPARRNRRPPPASGCARRRCAGTRPRAGRASPRRPLRRCPAPAPVGMNAERRAKQRLRGGALRALVGLFQLDRHQLARALDLAGVERRAGQHVGEDVDAGVGVRCGQQDLVAPSGRSWSTRGTCRPPRRARARSGPPHGAVVLAKSVCSKRCARPGISGGSSADPTLAQSCRAITGATWLSSRITRSPLDSVVSTRVSGPLGGSGAAGPAGSPTAIGSFGDRHPPAVRPAVSATSGRVRGKTSLTARPRAYQLIGPVRTCSPDLDHSA